MVDIAKTVILLLIGGIISFFLFQIGHVLWNRMKQPDELREHLVGAPYLPDSRMAEAPEPDYEGPAQAHQSGAPRASMPEIPGQTESQVRTPEPLQRPVFRSEADEPEPTEATNLQQENAGFDENLRHPEASFKAHPYAKGSMQPMVDSGRASYVSTPGTSNQQPFESELAQNGGELMKGIFAFDTTEPNGFSSLF
jgi:hypothetical protein